MRGLAGPLRPYAAVYVRRRAAFFRRTPNDLRWTKGSARMSESRSSAVRPVTNAAVRSVHADAAAQESLVEFHLRKGLSLYSGGRPSTAIGPLRRAVEIAPENPEAHYLLGLAYKAVGKDPDAHEQWRKAVVVAAHTETASWARHTASRLLGEQGFDPGRQHGTARTEDIMAQMGLRRPKGDDR